MAHRHGDEPGHPEKEQRRDQGIKTVNRVVNENGEALCPRRFLAHTPHGLNEFDSNPSSILARRRHGDPITFVSLSKFMSHTRRHRERGRTSPSRASATQAG